jgi:hypothetical protein
MSSYGLECSCGVKFQADLYDSVNVTFDPELKNLILDGKINVITCSSCGKESYIDKSLLYHDMDANVMIYVHPKPEEINRDEIEQDLHKVIKPIPNVRFLLMFGMETLNLFLSFEKNGVPTSQIIQLLQNTYPILKNRIN